MPTLGGLLLLQAGGRQTVYLYLKLQQLVRGSWIAVVAAVTGSRPAGHTGA